MDPYALGIGALVSLIGGVADSSEKNKALGLQTDARKKLQDIKEPTIEEQQLALEKLQRGEKLTPVELQAVQMGSSAMEDISTDPRLKQAQLDALTSLQGISDSGGLQLTDRANLEKLLGQAATSDKGRRDAVTQNMQERGMGGSGLELAAKLASAQDASMQQNQAATNTAAQAQQNALQALQQGGALAGDIRGQDFNQEAAKAQAMDEISRFNAANQQQANTINAGYGMQANQYNTDRGNQVLDQNTNIANQQQTYNKGLYQQQFDNSLAKQNAVANATKEEAGQVNKIGSQISQGLGTVGQGIMQYGAPKRKKDEE